MRFINTFVFCLSKKCQWLEITTTTENKRKELNNRIGGPPKKRRVRKHDRRIPGPEKINLGLDGDVTRASRWHLVSVDEYALVCIARIEGEHTVDGVLLKALAEVARGQRTASGFREQASLGPLSLGVSWPGDVLDNDAPFTGRVLCTQRT